MVIESIDVGFIQAMGYVTEIVDTGVKIYVDDAVVHIFPDANDEDQFGMQAFIGDKEIYWVWFGSCELEDTFYELLDEIDR